MSPSSEEANHVLISVLYLLVGDFFYKAIEKQKSKKRLTYFLNLISPCQKQIHL